MADTVTRTCDVCRVQFEAVKARRGYVRRCDDCVGKPKPEKETVLTNCWHCHEEFVAQKWSTGMNRFCAECRATVPKKALNKISARKWYEAYDPPEKEKVVFDPDKVCKLDGCLETPEEIFSGYCTSQHERLGIKRRIEDEKNVAYMTRIPDIRFVPRDLAEG